MEPIKKYLATLLLLFFALFANAQESKNAANNTGSSIDGDTMMVVCIGILALVIVSLGRTVLFTIKYYSQKEIEKQASNVISAKPLLLLVLVLSSISAMAENVVATQVAANSNAQVSAFRMLLYIILLVELVIIFALQAMIKYFMKPELAKSTATTTQVAVKNEYWKMLWNKMNQFKPIEYEASIDTGHSYDGIRELNNVTPPWFKAAFIASIIFAAVYMYRYHVAHSAPLPQEELAIAMEEAKAEHETYLKTQKNLVDENNVVMLNEDGVSAGATLFKSNCVACHGAVGQGGVGPNLTDSYWLHGGSVKDVFKSIKYGWKEKGMQAWEGNFSPEQIAELASFVMSLKGSKPGNPKEPQGDLFKEQIVTNDSTNKLAMVDSIKK
jgi:cytochrome c oxidase cbb3-type subunit 3